MKKFIVLFGIICVGLNLYAQERYPARGTYFVNAANCPPDGLGGNCTLQVTTSTAVATSPRYEVRVSVILLSNGQPISRIEATGYVHKNGDISRISGNSDIFYVTNGRISGRQAYIQPIYNRSPYGKTVYSNPQDYRRHTVQNVNYNQANPNQGNAGHINSQPRSNSSNVNPNNYYGSWKEKSKKSETHLETDVVDTDCLGEDWLEMNDTEQMDCLCRTFDGNYKPNEWVTYRVTEGSSNEYVVYKILYKNLSCKKSVTFVSPAPVPASASFEAPRINWSSLGKRKKEDVTATVLFAENKYVFYFGNLSKKAYKETVEDFESAVRDNCTDESQTKKWLVENSDKIE